MSKLMLALIVGAGLVSGGTATAETGSPTNHPPGMSKSTYTQAVKDADAHYGIDKQACSSLSGNAKDICLAEAKGKYNAAKADAEAAYKNTDKAREEARVVRAEARHNVAIEKCDDLAGNAKDVCVKEADADLAKAKANAKVERVAADTNREAATKQAEARQEANKDKLEADYEVAVEKCDALAGAAKESCVNNAKAQYARR